MIWPKASIYNWKQKRTFIIVEGDCNPKTFKSQNPNYTHTYKKKITLSFYQNLFLYFSWLYKNISKK